MTSATEVQQPKLPDYVSEFMWTSVIVLKANAWLAIRVRTICSDCENLVGIVMLSNSWLRYFSVKPRQTTSLPIATNLNLSSSKNTYSVSPNGFSSSFVFLFCIAPAQHYRHKTERKNEQHRRLFEFHSRFPPFIKSLDCFFIYKISYWFKKVNDLNITFPKQIRHIIFIQQSVMEVANVFVSLLQYHNLSISKQKTT